MRRFGWCLALVAVWFVAGPALADDADNKARKDEKAIRAGVDKWLSALEAGDLDHRMTLYMPHVGFEDPK